MTSLNMYLFKCTTKKYSDIANLDNIAAVNNYIWKKSISCDQLLMNRRLRRRRVLNRHDDLHTLIQGELEVEAGKEVNEKDNNNNDGDDDDDDDDDDESSAVE